MFFFIFYRVGGQSDRTSVGAYFSSAWQKSNFQSVWQLLRDPTGHTAVTVSDTDWHSEGKKRSNATTNSMHRCVDFFLITAFC